VQRIFCIKTEHMRRVLFTAGLAVWLLSCGSSEETTPTGGNATGEGGAVNKGGDQYGGTENGAGTATGPGTGAAPAGGAATGTNAGTGGDSTSADSVQRY
jgi:hypothetical protein